jgi:pilus assembly protein CpaB
MSRDATATARRIALVPRTARGTPTGSALRLRVLAWRLRIPAAAVCVGIAVSLVVGRLAPAPPETVRVPVAARALAAGTVLAEQDVMLREVPADLVPAGLVRATAGSTGAGADGATNAGGVGEARVDEADADEPSAGGTGAGGTGTVAARSDGTGADATAARSDGAAAGPGGTATLPDADSQGLLDGLLGGRLAVAVPEGFPLVTSLLTDPATEAPAGTVVVPVRFGDPALAALLVPGTRVDVVAASVLDGVEPERVAAGALVLGPGAGSGAGAGTGAGDAGDAAGTGTAEAAGTGAAAGLLSGSGADGTGSGTTDGPVLLAVSPAEALRLSGAAASDVLSAVIVG